MDRRASPIAVAQPGAGPVTRGPRTAQIGSWTAGWTGLFAGETAALRKPRCGEHAGPSLAFATVSCVRRSFGQVSRWSISARARAC
jgi:hypothetical protein